MTAISKALIAEGIVIGDFARAVRRSGSMTIHSPDCGHEKLLAFTCKSRHFCPACHQRRTRQTGAWTAASVCHDVPHRQFVFTFPKMLRGIFRKRRHLLHHLFQTAIESLRDAFRARLGLPGGRIATAAVYTFGDYLVFHPHLHIFAADGLFDEDGRFHSMPDESLAPLAELFRHRFLQVLRDEKHLSAQKVAELLSWKHSGFHIDGGEKPVAPGDTKGRPNIRHSKFATATDFLAAAIDHIPPRPADDPLLCPLLEQKTRPATPPASSGETDRGKPAGGTSGHPASTQNHRPRHAPLWRDLILRVWGADPLQCPCCQATMQCAGTIVHPGEVQFFLRLHGLWEA